MDRFLEDKRLAGELDSEGGFTLDALGALRKTLASALPEPHYYLLQIAQGLIAAGARNIEVAIGRETTRFHFSDEAGLFQDLGTAKSRLTSGLTLSSPHPWDLVLSGMATAVGAEMDRALLRLPEQQQALELTLERCGLVKAASPLAHGKAVIELHRSVSLGLSFAWTRVWGARNQEEELQRRFEFATPPLKIAGFATVPGNRWRQEVPVTTGAGRLILCEAAILDPVRPTHRGPQLSFEGSPAETAVRCLVRRAFDPQGVPLAEGAHDWEERVWSFYGTARVEPESTVWWIRNGMTVEKSQHLLELPGLFVLAPADDLDLDASGYGLVKNEKFQRRLQQASNLAKLTLGGISHRQVSDVLARPDVMKALIPGGASRLETTELLRQYRWLGE